MKASRSLDHSLTYRDESFDAYIYRLSLPLRVKSLFAAILLLFVFGIFDLVVFPSDVYSITLPVRFLLVLIPLLITLVFLGGKSDTSKSISTSLLYFIFIAAGCMNATINYIVIQHGYELPNIGIILIIMFGALLLALPLLGAGISAFIVIAVSSIPIFLTEKKLGQFIYHWLSLSIFTSLCLIANNIYRSMARNNYLLLNRLYNESVVEPLTKLYNRRYFDEQYTRLFEQAKRDNKSIAIILIDVDCFKEFNDSLGHLAGDLALTQIAKVIAATCRRPNDFAARYGGDEFVTVYFDMGMEKLVQVCEEIVNQVFSQKMAHEQSMIADYFSVSVGGTSVKAQEVHDSLDLFNLADDALYQAKKNGKNQFKVNHITCITHKLVDAENISELEVSK